MFSDLLKGGYISVFRFAAIDGDYNQHTGGLGQRIPSLRVYNKNTFEPNFNTGSGYKSIVIPKKLEKQKWYHLHISQKKDQVRIAYYFQYFYIQIYRMGISSSFLKLMELEKSG